MLSLSLYLSFSSSFYKKVNKSWKKIWGGLMVSRTSMDVNCLGYFEGCAKGLGLRAEERQGTVTAVLNGCAKETSFASLYLTFCFAFKGRNMWCVRYGSSFVNKAKFFWGWNLWLLFLNPWIKFSGAMFILMFSNARVVTDFVHKVVLQIINSCVYTLKLQSLNL